MLSYLVKRVVSGSLLVVLLSMAVYALFWFGPESPAAELCRRSIRCTPERLAQFEDRLGYNNPIHVEYGKWAKGLFVDREIQVGAAEHACPAPCLGISYRDRGLVADQLKDRFPVTLSIAFGASTLYLITGVTVGVAAARRRGTFGDRALVTSTLVVSSIPFYLVALVSCLLLTIRTSAFPEVEYVPITQDPIGWFSGLLLVWLVMGSYGATQYARFSRGAMVESLSEDYVRTAKAKGLKTRTVVVKHALRAALVPVVTIFGLDFAFLLSGTVFTEAIFGLEGIGEWGLDATYTMDLPVVQATTLVLAVAVVIGNIIVDIAYSWLDPRVRLR